MAPVTTQTMAGAVDDGDGIERLRYDGRVHRWSKKVAGQVTSQVVGHRPGWPGHTTFVALRGGAVVVGDRYAGEGFERTYACDLASLLEGCFQDLVAQQLGPRVLEELLDEARRELGIAASPAPKPPKAPPAKDPPPTAPPTVVGASAPAPAPSKVVSAPSKPAVVTAVPTPKPVAAAVPTAVLAPASTPEGGPVDVAVVACPSVGLPLAVALRGITRASVHELLGRLQSLPCRVATGVPREQAEGVAARLSELGAEVRVSAAGGS